MSYLKKLPIDTIKIDKSFIDEIPENTSDVAITKAILTLAKSLKYKVVAEGIESSEQEQFLMDQSCDVGQGYLFSEPMRNEAFIRFMKNRYSISLSSETILR
jgi:sensor c-di-GMP phosphodiesterase-like protein